METDFTFMGWKVQYGQDDNSLQIDYKFNVIPIKIQEVFFVLIEQLIIKCKGPTKSHNHFESEA